MGTLVFVCPITGFEVFTGLEMDQSTFADLPSVLPDIRCPHCPKPHQLSDVTAWLAEEERRTDGIARELDEANLVLDEWNVARTRDKQSDTIAPCERAGDSRD